MVERSHTQVYKKISSQLHYNNATSVSVSTANLSHNITATSVYTSIRAKRSGFT